MTPTRAELEQLAQSPEGMKRYTIVDPCHQWQYHEHREGMWVKHEDADAELTALREAVRVLGEEVASRIQLEQATANVAAMPIPPLDPSHPLREKLRVLAQAELGALTAMDARNANPIARAEVEKPS